MRIKAKEILKQVCESSWCKEACEFYDSKNISKNTILEQGSANFDEMVGKNGERKWYRAAYYAGANGYMDMHIRHNRTVFRHHRLIKSLLKKRTLFVDYGCGPMTSGVMLADTLSESMSNYKNQIIYVGIDISKNMCKIAEWVNTIGIDSHIFNKFYILNNDSLNLRDLDRIISEHFRPDVTVFCLSYVLAPKTFSGEHVDAIDIAQSWRNFIRQLDCCRESYIIYMNPKFMYAHRNWNYFVQEYTNSPSIDWKHNISERKFVSVDGLLGTVDTQMIIDKRRP